MSPETLILLLAFAFGASFGSFLNVCIARLPVDLSVVRPASRCPRCARPIRAHENIPLVGWLLLRGRCAGCRLPISMQYPLVELAVAILWTVSVWHFGPTVTALRVAVFGTVLLGIAATDLEHYLIPDGFTVFGFGFLIATALWLAVAGRDPAPFAGAWAAILGACVGAGAIAIAGWLGEVAMGREAMGLGDVTLMAMAGAALGPERALLTVFVGAALATVVFLAVVHPVVAIRNRARGGAVGAAGPTTVAAREGAGGDASAADVATDDDGTGLPQVPFGVFLAPAALVTLLWGDALIGWYVARL